MNRLFIIAFFLSLTGFRATAQTEEPIHYKITVPTGADLTLDGTLTLPKLSGKPVPVLLLIAGSGPTDRDCNSGANLKTNAYKLLADSLAQLGIAVARYDKRYSGTNLKAAVSAVGINQHRFDFFVNDAVGLVRQLRADKRFSKVIIAGHSEGSLVGMLAAGQVNASKFISIAGPGRNIADVIKEQLKTSMGDTLRTLSYKILDSLRAGHVVNKVNPFLLSVFSPGIQPYMISWMKYDPAVEIRRYTGPVLIINGEHDIQVAVSEAQLLKAARPDARLALFDQMNHILKNASADRTENRKTYTNLALPLTPGLVTAIARFINSY